MQRCQEVFSHVHTWRTSHNTLLDIIYEKSMKCQVYSSPRKYSNCNCKCNRTDQIMWTLEWEASWDMYLDMHWLALCSCASSQFTWWVCQQEQIQFSVDIAYDKNVTPWKFFLQHMDSGSAKNTRYMVRDIQGSQSSKLEIRISTLTRLKQAHKSVNRLLNTTCITENENESS